MEAGGDADIFPAIDQTAEVEALVETEPASGRIDILSTTRANLSGAQFRLLDRLMISAFVLMNFIFWPSKLMLALIPILVRQGRVINIGDKLLPPMPMWAAYQASKKRRPVVSRGGPGLNARGSVPPSICRWCAPE